MGGHGPLGNAWCTVPVLLFQLPVICKSEGGKRSVLFLQFSQEMLIQPQDKIIRLLFVIIYLKLVIIFISARIKNILYEKICYDLRQCEKKVMAGFSGFCYLASEFCS